MNVELKRHEIDYLITLVKETQASIVKRADKSGEKLFFKHHSEEADFMVITNILKALRSV